MSQTRRLRDRCTSIFPSITPAATTSIVTGRYPADHGIAGAFWYEPERETVAYYGYDFWVILRRGIDDFVNDFLVRLNQDRLRAATLFERVEDGDRTAASLNYLAHRGRHDRSLRVDGHLGQLQEARGGEALRIADEATGLMLGREYDVVSSQVFGSGSAEYLLSLRLRVCGAGAGPEGAVDHGGQADTGSVSRCRHLPGGVRRLLSQYPPQWTSNRPSR